MQNRIIECIYILSIFCSIAYYSNLFTATYLVDQHGTGSFTSIADAVSSTTVQSGDTILLAAGQTFTGTSNSGITIDKNLTFDTSDTTQSMPIVDLSNTGNNLFSIDPGFTVTISNLIIENGSVATLGGAILNYGILIAYSCTFSNNSATTEGGGALYNYGSMTITSCNFDDNNSNFGSALYSELGSILIADSTFSNNSATYDGGAIYYLEGTLTVSGCTFSNNNASGNLGGGAIFNEAGKIIVSSCIFNGNSASGLVGGGAIYNDGGEETAILSIYSCIFINNTATTPYAGGGALYNDGNGSAILTSYNCTFSNNSAIGGLGGGVIYNDGDHGSASLTLSNCTFSNNNAFNGDTGGAIYNDGDLGSAVLNLMNCYFNGNSSDSAGGAIYNTWDDGTVALTAFSCNFIDNNTTGSGGALYNDSGTITTTVQCSRFVNNTATDSGPALYGNSGTINAIDNWWGSNTDPSVAGLFGGSGINYEPWIIMAIQANPASPWLGGTSTITTDFTQNSSGQQIGACFPDGTPILFTTSFGTITPTSAATVGGIATATASTNRLATTCAIAGPGAEDYSQCVIIDPIPQGLYRLNFGCICSDTTTTQHILIGSYNSTGTNSLKGWVLDGNSPVCSLITPLILTPNILYNVAVYNEQDIINLSILTTTTSNGHNLSLATSFYNGSNYVITPQGSPLTLPNAAFKVQWFVSGGIPYVAVDTIDNIRIYPIDLSSYTFGDPIQTPNMGNSQYASDFLYWLPTQDNNLFLVQGFNNTNIATYQVDLNGTPTIYPGVVTDVSSTFTNINSCATCNNYFLVGGSAQNQGILAKYTINTFGVISLELTATIADTTTVNYCERCCCSDSQLLVGTDKGLFSYVTDSLDLISSYTEGTNNNWLNACWCCNNANQFCAAINNAPSAFILEQQNPTFNTICQLQ